jgi:ribonuclease HII
VPGPLDRQRSTASRPDLRFEKTLLRRGYLRLAAMDEVGRGALAGPVSVGVVVVTPGIGRVPAGLRDSKLLTPAAREALISPVRRWVKEYGVGHASADEIDAIGIMAALRLAARRALDQLAGPVDAVLLDGNHDYLNPRPAAVDPQQEPLFTEAPAIPTGPTGPIIPVHVKIKADLTCAAVAGASVLAKTERDRHLVELSPAHPRYNFAVNKGYGTPEHLAALREHGPCPVHRRSWRLGAGMDPMVDDPMDSDVEWKVEVDPT